MIFITALYNSDKQQFLNRFNFAGHPPEEVFVMSADFTYEQPNIKYRLRAVHQHSLHEAAGPMRKPGAHMLLLIKGGMGTLTLDSKKYALSVGQLYYAPPDAAWQIEPHFNEVIMLMLDFECLELVHEADHQVTAIKSVRNLFAQRELAAPLSVEQQQLADKLALCVKESSLAQPQHAEALFQQWLHLLLRECVPCADTPSPADRTLEIVLKYLEDHFAEEIGREQMAQMAGFTPEYFSAWFKQHCGKRLTDYLSERRIRHVKELLLFGHVRLSEAARQAGYKDEYYLSRRFKAVTGLPPSRYVQAVRRIVSLSPHLTMHLLCLGIFPIATVAFPWQFGDYTAKLAAAGCVIRDWSLDFTTAELEQLQPDLILTIDNLDPRRLDDCRRLAPTFVIPWYRGDWKEHLHQLAHILRKQSSCHSYLEGWEARLQMFKQQWHDAGLAQQSMTIINIRNESALLYLNRGMGSELIYRDLQTQIPPAVQHAVKDKSALPVAFDEILPRYAAEQLLLVVQPTAQAALHSKALMQSLSWQQAMESGMKLYRVEMARWHGYDPISSDWQLHDLARQFAAFH